MTGCCMRARGRRSGITFTSSAWMRGWPIESSSTLASPGCARTWRRSTRYSFSGSSCGPSRTCLRNLPIVATTVEWLRAHWDHPSWSFLWRALFEGGLRGDVEELGFDFCGRYPTAARTTFVAEPLHESMGVPPVSDTAALAAAYPLAPCSYSCLARAYREEPGDLRVAASCRQWLLAHPGEKPEGWINLFELLQPEHHSAETIALGAAMIGSGDLLNRPRHAPPPRAELRQPHPPAEDDSHRYHAPAPRRPRASAGQAVGRGRQYALALGSRRPGRESGGGSEARGGAGVKGRGPRGSRERSAPAGRGHPVPCLRRRARGWGRGRRAKQQTYCYTPAPPRSFAPPRWLLPFPPLLPRNPFPSPPQPTPNPQTAIPLTLPYKPPILRSLGEAGRPSVKSFSLPPVLFTSCSLCAILHAT